MPPRRDASASLHGRPRGARRRGRGGTRGERPGIHRLSGIHCVREALLAGRRELLRLWVDEQAARGGDVAALCERAAAMGLPVTAVAADDLVARLDPSARRSNPQGLVLEAGPLPEPTLEELLEGAASDDFCLVVLDGVEDPQNVGAIARVAEAAGADGLVLGSRRAPPIGPAAARASAGAVEWLPIARVPNLSRALDQLQAAGLWVVGAQVEAPTSLFEVPERILRGPLAVLMGAEGKGLREGVQRRVDHPVSIPMAGHVGSLNVATATAVVLFELVRRRAARSAGDASQ
ncbi:MAG: 23S rRNA (guanosine(2251)-2'-O)-methyltransferase RlmB [Myxococcota bacterium]|nr:23S rRNA (guanosine(2251)-2'-O)-methyltransferase RlmB [Myxococcales bacterium]